MPDSIPPITPAQRQRLQKVWEKARGAMTHFQSAPSRQEAERIHELLSECAATDPGNTLYIDACLLHLRALRRLPKSRWWFLKVRMFFGGGEELPNSTDFRGLLAGLATVPNKSYPHELQLLARACSLCDFSEAEVRYLREALHISPNDPSTLAKLAQSLLRQGRFDESRAVVRRLQEVSTGFSDAKEIFEILDGPVSAIAPRTEAISRNESEFSAADFLKEATELAALKKFDEAEAAAAKALSLSGGDLAVREQVEEISLARLKNNVAIARRLVEHEPSEAHQRTLRRWEIELGRLALETLNARSERFPQDAGLKLEVAIRLKRAGNYSGAIQRLEEIPADSPQRASALLELGENWQHLRQFDKALDFYRHAIEGAETLNQAESLKLSLYRAGCLATAMNQAPDAQVWFQRLLEMDTGFKDARERFRKLDVAGSGTAD